MSLNSVVVPNITDASGNNTNSYILKEIEILKTQINKLLIFFPSCELSDNTFNTLNDYSGKSIHAVLSVLLQDKFSRIKNTFPISHEYKSQHNCSSTICSQDYSMSSFQILLNHRDSLKKQLDELDVPLVSLLDPIHQNNTNLINWLSNIKVNDMVNNLGCNWWKNAVPFEISLIVHSFYEKTLKEYYDKYVTLKHTYQHLCQEIQNLEKNASEIIKKYSKTQ